MNGMYNNDLLMQLMRGGAPNSPMFQVSDPQAAKPGNNMPKAATGSPQGMPKNFMHQATQFAGGPMGGGEQNSGEPKTPWGDKQNFFGMNNMDAMMLGLGLGGNVWFR